MRITSLLISLTLVATASQAKSQDLSLLEMPELGLVINHPKNWQVTTVRKSADLKVAIPIEGSSQKAQLELYNIAFNSEKDVWQLGQKAINDRMKREIMRQWEEEFLGVPMLLTKVSFVDKEGPQILLTGLIYSRTGKKMMFRLAASPDDFDKAEFMWREAMNGCMDGLSELHASPLWTLPSLRAGLRVWQLSELPASEGGTADFHSEGG